MNHSDLVFNRLNTTDAEAFEGLGGKVIFDVWAIDNGDWPTGAELNLLWKSPLKDIEPEVWRTVEGLTFTASGSKRVYLTDGGIYKFTSDIAGIQCYKWNASERVRGIYQD